LKLFDNIFYYASSISSILCFLELGPDFDDFGGLGLSDGLDFGGFTITLSGAGLNATCGSSLGPPALIDVKNTAIIFL
jgi:hypothetical protein